jgi:hypothetical protein
MDKKITTKWYSSDALDAAEEVYKLSTVNIEGLTGRLTQEELNNLQTNFKLFEGMFPKKKIIMVDQKSKTSGQGEQVDELRKMIANIRDMVRNAKTVTDEIAKAYDVGESYASSIVKAVAAGEVAINAYARFTTWSNKIGIIDTDIENVRNQIDLIKLAEKAQDTAIGTRKGNTLDFKKLQRSIEDEVTRISKMGVLAFRKKDSILASQFANIIPSKVKTKETSKAASVKTNATA